MAGKIKNLIFDLGNVIIPIDESLSRKALLDLLGAGALDRFEETVFYDFERGRMSTESMINHLQRLSNGKVPTPDVLIDAWNSMLFEIPSHRMDMLKNLSADYQIFILSNTNEFHLGWVRRHLKDRYEIDDFTQDHALQAFYSHEIGHRKPDADVYEYVIEMAGIDPGESIFFDDKHENILSAIKSGFWAYLVRPEDEITEIIKDMQPDIL